MLLDGQHLQVFDLVVHFLFVLVVDMLCRCQFPTKMALHRDPVLCGQPTANPDLPVSLIRNHALILAGLSAKPVPVPFRQKGRSATFAQFRLHDCSPGKDALGSP